MLLNICKAFWQPSSALAVRKYMSRLRTSKGVLNQHLLNTRPGLLQMKLVFRIGFDMQKATACKELIKFLGL